MADRKPNPEDPETGREGRRPDDEPPDDVEPARRTKPHPIEHDEPVSEGDTGLDGFR